MNFKPTHKDKLEAFNMIRKLTRAFQIIPIVRKRSLDQNSLHWLHCNYLEDQNIGYTKDEWHEMFIEMFADRDPLPEIVTGKGQPRRWRAIRTKAMTTKQMTDFINRYTIFANTELEIELPTGNEKNISDLYNHYVNKYPKEFLTWKR